MVDTKEAESVLRNICFDFEFESHVVIPLKVGFVRVAERYVRIETEKEYLYLQPDMIWERSPWMYATKKELQSVCKRFKVEEEEW